MVDVGPQLPPALTPDTTTRFRDRGRPRICTQSAGVPSTEKTLRPQFLEGELLVRVHLVTAAAHLDDRRHHHHLTQLRQFAGEEVEPWASTPSSLVRKNFRKPSASGGWRERTRRKPTVGSAPSLAVDSWRASDCGRIGERPSNRCGPNPPTAISSRPLGGPISFAYLVRRPERKFAYRRERCCRWSPRPTRKTADDRRHSLRNESSRGRRPATSRPAICPVARSATRCWPVDASPPKSRCRCSNAPTKNCST